MRLMLQSIEERFTARSGTLRGANLGRLSAPKRGSGGSSIKGQSETVIDTYRTHHLEVLLHVLILGELVPPA